jgi:hypothetical protein
LDCCPKANFDLLGFDFRAGAPCDLRGRNATEDGPEAFKGEVVLTVTPAVGPGAAHRAAEEGRRGGMK